MGVQGQVPGGVRVRDMRVKEERTGCSPHHPEDLYMDPARYEERRRRMQRLP